jgi:hypothetical protein
MGPEPWVAAGSLATCHASVDRRPLRTIPGPGQDAPMPSRIVTSVHRPKRPPPKRKATALQVPAIVQKAKSGNDARQREAEHLPTAEKKPAIVTGAEAGAVCRCARHDVGGALAARRGGGRTVGRLGAQGDQQGLAVTRSDRRQFPLYQLHTNGCSGGTVRVICRLNVAFGKSALPRHFAPLPRWSR